MLPRVKIWNETMARKITSRRNIAILLVAVSLISLLTLKKGLESGIVYHKIRTASSLLEFAFPKNTNVVKKKANSKVIYLGTNYFGQEWSNSYYYFDKNKDSFVSERCSFSNCYVTKDHSELDTSDAVLFHSRDVKMEDLAIPRKPNQIWILYSLEPPWLELLDWRKLNGVFNWTMSYRSNSSVKAKHGYYRTRKNYERVKKMFKRKKDVAAWFVSNCRTESRREDYVRALKLHFPVDVLGGCGRDICRPANSRKCYLKLEKSYKFYLSFENSICSNYVTEKLFEILKYYIVPIVFGGANYSAIAPPGSFINAIDFPNPQDLAAYLWNVSKNDELYNSFFAWKGVYEVLPYPWMCHLCEKLHSVRNGSISIIGNLSKWWNEQSECKQWDSEEKQFVGVLSNTVPRYNSRDFSS